MIAVTASDGSTLYLAAHLISSVVSESGRSGSFVTMNNQDVYHVREDAEYIFTMIKFEMGKYHR